ncbi:MipA/OmpV family protein [Microvirga puerhi]|uniref:MipA/OmpV family protein n=1 Tax=Microvirga puerhi TaxID=2876078 RepID=A0ABS7VUP8_9HYPH|nr:MipA/OmpV family protein [Microvirga puerhi]MBZ6078871.1 MipA/OmpV family protein [Microvirga puerhi]
MLIVQPDPNASRLPKRTLYIAIPAYSALALSVLPAQAQDILSPTPSAEASSAWIVTLTGTGLVSPKYEGASAYGLSGFPSVGFRHPNEPEEFSAPDDSLDYTLFSTSGWKVGPVANIRSGRSAQDDSRLSGLRNYPWAIEAGVFVEYWPIQDRLRTRLEVRHGLHRHDGFVADLSADLIQKFGAFTLSGGPRASLADNSIMEKEFGISPAGALRNGMLPAFSAHGGVKSVGLEAAVSYDWSDQWRTTVFQRYDRLVGDAGASPITTRLGSRNQLIFGLELTYAFELRSH